MCSIILMLIIYTDVVTSPLYHQSVQYPQLMFLLCYLLTIYLTIPSNPSTLLLLDMLFCYPWPKVCHHLMLSIPLSCFSVCHWWVNSFRIFFFSLIFTEHNIFQFYPGNLSLLTFLTATYYSFVCVCIMPQLPYLFICLLDIWVTSISIFCTQHQIFGEGPSHMKFQVKWTFVRDQVE